MKVVLPLPAMPTQTIATGSSDDGGEVEEEAMVCVRSCRMLVVAVRELDYRGRRGMLRLQSRALSGRQCGFEWPFSVQRLRQRPLGIAPVAQRERCMRRSIELRVRDGGQDALKKSRLPYLA